MQLGKARFAWVIAAVIVAVVIATLSATGHGLDALMMALLVSLLIGAYFTRRNVRAALLYNQLRDGRARFSSHRVPGGRRADRTTDSIDRAPESRTKVRM
jgi:hypothetical protein